MLVKLDVLLL